MTVVRRYGLTALRKLAYREVAVVRRYGITALRKLAVTGGGCCKEVWYNRSQKIGCYREVAVVRQYREQLSENWLL